MPHIDDATRISITTQRPPELQSRSQVQQTLGNSRKKHCKLFLLLLLLLPVSSVKCASAKVNEQRGNGRGRYRYRYLCKYA